MTYSQNSLFAELMTLAKLWCSQQEYVSLENKEQFRQLIIRQNLGATKLQDSLVSTRDNPGIRLQAQIFLNIPKAQPFHETCLVTGEIPVVDYSLRWQKIISPLIFERCYSTEPSSKDFTNRVIETWHQVVCQDGQWKIYAFWSDDQFAKILQERQSLLGFLG